MTFRRRHAAARLAVFAGGMLLAVQLHAQSYESAYSSYVNQDFANSRRELEALGEHPSPEVEYLLGSEYIQALGGRARVERGFDLMRDAASRNNTAAMSYLAKTYFLGDHRFVAESVARIYLEQAAKEGDPAAIALIAQEGHLPEVKVDEGVKEDNPSNEVAPNPSVIDQETNNTTEAPLTSIADESGHKQPIDLLQETQSSVSPSTPQLPIELKNRTTRVQAEEPNYLPFLGGVALMGFLLFRFWGVKCPQCKKRRVSTLVDQEQLDQYVTTRMRTVSSTTRRQNSGGHQTGISHTSSQVPVTVTVREYLNSYECLKCGCHFQQREKKEMA